MPRLSKTSQMKRILVVEDEAAERRAMVSLLKINPNLLVIGVSTAQEAIEYVNEHFDLVIIDYHLGEVDGDVVLKKWLPKQPDTHFVFLTGETSVRIGVDMIKNGATEFMNKPIDADEFLSTVDRLLA